MRFILYVTFTIIGSLAQAAPSYCSRCGNYGGVFGPENSTTGYYCFLEIQGNAVISHRFRDVGGTDNRKDCMTAQKKVCAHAELIPSQWVHGNPCFNQN